MRKQKYRRTKKLQESTEDAFYTSVLFDTVIYSYILNFEGKQTLKFITYQMGLGTGVACDHTCTHTSLPRHLHIVY